MPERIQLRRTAGWRMPPNTVKVDRSTPLGNPFSVEVFGQAQAVAMHRVWLETETAAELGYAGQQADQLDARRAAVMAALPGLRGMNLACWCALPAEGERDLCHAVTYLEKANA